MKKVNKIYYDLMIATLSITVVVIVLVETLMDLSKGTLIVLRCVDFSIWVIFLVDYFFRLYKESDKINFIKNNKIDLISILPLNTIMMSLRIFKISGIIKVIKLSKLAKAMVFVGKFEKKLGDFIKTNNLNYIIISTIAVVILGSLAISIVEGISFNDALWWSFVTVTTVGYGDISPQTYLGRGIAILLMLVGIGFISMLTGTIATYFLNKHRESKTYKEVVVDEIKLRLDKFDDLSTDDLRIMFSILEKLKDGENEKNIKK
ncbi:potassium channel family protein [Clostridium sp.]|uniref:potassium channel family protein n=1 Tax=Clostridium sp. TaxID=1506 RepID=UPI003F405A75